MKSNSVLSRLWNLLFPRKSSRLFSATEDNLVLNIDFSMSEWIDPKTKEVWAAITILKAPYSGVKIKYNDIGVTEVIEDEAERLSINYDFIDTAGRAIKVLEEDQNFNNLIFNIAYALVVSLNKNDDEDEKEGIDEHLDRENLFEPRRDNIGEFDLK